MCVFEFDETKSASNFVKHGIDFHQAQALWNDDNYIQFSAQTFIENRTIVVGLLSDKHWAAVVTEREGAVRIISVRRARKREIEMYESERF